MGKGHNAKGATGKKKVTKAKASAKGSRIEKRKHVRGATSDGKQRLVQKLKADAPAPKAAQKQKRADELREGKNKPGNAAAAPKAQAGWDAVKKDAKAGAVAAAATEALTAAK